jgi:hypothetical protein
VIIPRDRFSNEFNETFSFLFKTRRRLCCVAVDAQKNEWPDHGTYQILSIPVVLKWNSDDYPIQHLEEAEREK